MALSKPVTEEMVEKLNTTGTSRMIITIPEDEIKMFCWHMEPHAVSIDLINHLLGGDKMNYAAMNLEDSIQCHEFTLQHVMKCLQETKQDILFFEQRKDKQSDVFLVATRQPKGKAFVNIWFSEQWFA